MDITAGNDSGQQIAVLIDGDNVSPKILPSVLAEISKYGTVAVRRVYGDWTREGMSGWKDALQEHAVQPVQQFAYTTGKNSTDSALIIDAMDLLHGGRMQSFCIVSSDSDYTRLATRIREQGLAVVGMGEKKTPKALVNACRVFVYLENLTPKPPSKGVEAPPATQAATAVESPTDVGLLVEKASEMTAGDDGWANLGAVGNQLRSLDPSFDCRTYGHNRLVDLVESLGQYDIRHSNPGGPGTVYVRRSR